MKKKIVLYEEPVFFAAIVFIALAVAMQAAADLGVSMIVAPAYILSMKLGFLTFGQAEYIIQGLMFIALCVVMGKVKLTYFFSFVTCLVYGPVLDLWRRCVSAFNPDITEPGNFSMLVRIVFFAVSMLLTAFSVALFFKVYLYPLVYDFFVKLLSQKLCKNTVWFKTCFDVCCLLTALAMTLLFFRRIEGIGVGTVVLALGNGFIISLCGRLLDKYCEFRPLFSKAKKLFTDYSD